MDLCGICWFRHMTGPLRDQQRLWCVKSLHDWAVVTTRDSWRFSRLYRRERFRISCLWTFLQVFERFTNCSSSLNRCPCLFALNEMLQDATAKKKTFFFWRFDFNAVQSTCIFDCLTLWDMEMDLKKSLDFVMATSCRPRYISREVFESTKRVCQTMGL